MKIKKIGHCCLIIETQGKRIMTDPGSFTAGKHNQEKNIDLILITHEHGDHLHAESLVEVLKNNNAMVITNESVGKLLKQAGIEHRVLEDKKPQSILGVEIEAHDCKHEEIFEDFGQVQNTAFFVDQKLFYPGDAYYNPGRSVEILALPVAGPWTQVKRAMEYALEIKPRICFAVHDGMLNTYGSNHKVPELILPQHNIDFKNFESKEEEEF